jgi:hypothetical protein
MEAKYSRETSVEFQHTKRRLSQETVLFKRLTADIVHLNIFLGNYADFLERRWFLRNYQSNCTERMKLKLLPKYSRRMDMVNICVNDYTDGYEHDFFLIFPQKEICKITEIRRPQCMFVQYIILV